MKKEVKLIKKVKRLLKRLNCSRYLHHFGPKKYAFYQHIFALLVKIISRRSFRRVCKFLELFDIEVPTYSALCKMRKRILPKLWDAILQATVNFESYIVAVDSTGFSRTNPSWYYIKRIDRKKPVKSYVKLSSFFDTRRKKFLALKVRARPRHDIKDIPSLLRQRSNFKKLVGDSAYDAESLHEQAFDLGIKTIIKPKKNARKGFHRRKQREHYRKRTYGRRNMQESGFGSLKRKYGSFLLARRFSTQKAELYCAAIAHNLGLRF